MKFPSVMAAFALAIGLSACSGTGVNAPAPLVPTFTPPAGSTVPLATPAACPPTLLCSSGQATYLKAAYLDAFASGSLGTVTPGGWKAPNVILVGFANPTSSATVASISGALATMAASRPAAQTGNAILLSIGGANVVPSSWTQAPATLAANLVAQINAYNAALSGSNQVAGIDLDLENGFTSAAINGIAQALKSVTLASGQHPLVGIAPQVVGVNGPAVDATAPANLGLSAGGINNNYGLALQNGYIDDVFAQAYNSGPTVIALNNVTAATGPAMSGINESNVLFIQGIAQALSGVVAPTCAGATTLCIPAGTKIFVGTVANQGGGGNYTIFNPNAQTPVVAYNQATTLAALSSELTYMFATNRTPYANVAGVMMWALGNDYGPALYGDTYAASGAFSAAIFGAPAPPAGPSILLQMSNNGSTAAIITLIKSGQYYAFPSLNPSSNATWCTIAGASTYGCTDSYILDQVGASTVTVQVTANGVAWICPQGSGVGAGGAISLVNGRYNLQVNTTYKSCAFASF